MDFDVSLGEAMTDGAKRLTILGGKGISQSYDGAAAITFANNEGWYDDVSDGPVTAKVVLNGEQIQVVPAWVVVAPPNYGPQRKSVRTMWDLMRDVAVKGEHARRSDAPVVHARNPADLRADGGAAMGECRVRRRFRLGRGRST